MTYKAPRYLYLVVRIRSEGKFKFYLADEDFEQALYEKANRDGLPNMGWLELVMAGVFAGEISPLSAEINFISEPRKKNITTYILNAVSNVCDLAVVGSGNGWIL